MHDATSQTSTFRLAIAPGVPSPYLTLLLARHRAEDPDVALTLFEIADDVLLEGLREGRYDAGVSLQGFGDSALKTQPLWAENIAVAMPPRFHLLGQAVLTIADLEDYPIYRWQAEACPRLEERLASLVGRGHDTIQQVASFEMMALRVAAGYGIGLSARSRIERGREWGIDLRPLEGGPYEIVVYLQRLQGDTNPAVERFEQKALEVARTGIALQTLSWPGLSSPGCRLECKA